jgi:hypothetical protein
MVSGAAARRRGWLAAAMGLLAGAAALIWVGLFRTRAAHDAGGWGDVAGALARSLVIGGALGALAWWRRGRRRPGEPS